MKLFQQILLTASMCVLSAFGQSQLGTGAINGLVLDPSGQSVVDASITVRNTETQLTRTTASNATGAFSVAVLPIGKYIVKISHAGFRTTEQSDIAVSVGGSATVIAKLEVGSVTESITVTDSILIDTSKTTEADLVDRKQIQDLPINGRRVDQFALLSPGVARDGRFGLLSFHGASGNFNNYLIEGNDDNQAYFSEPRGRTRIASSVSANAVQEFQVGKGAFSAEFGRASGGSINTVIRSGGNSLHGDGFYYYRDQNFQARDPLASLRPDERRQQFGGSLAGPAKKDKLFFFINYDQQVRDFPLLIEDLNGVLNSGKPTLAANATAAQQDQYAKDLKAFQTGSAFLKAQFPNGAPGNTQTRNLNQYLGLFKVDYLLNESNTISVFYNHLTSTGERAIQSSLVLPNVGRNGSDDVRVDSLNGRLTTTFGGSRVNEVRFQYGRDFEFEFADQPPPQTTINFGGNPFSFGRATFLERPAYPDERRYQFIDNYSWNFRNHTFKFGGEANRVHDGVDNPGLFGGQYSYATALAIGRDLVDPTARNYTSYAQNFGVSGIPFATVDTALFVQDQWKLTRRLTLNYGLRYDRQFVPDPVNPNPAIPQSQNIPTDNRAFGPRAGAAWDIAGNGKTVLRGGYALYYARTPNGLIENALAQTGLNDPTKVLIALSFQPTDPAAPLYPKILTGIPAGASASASIFRLDSTFRQARIQDFNLAVERQLGKDLLLTASFIHTIGDRLETSFDANLPNPQFTRIYQLPAGTTFEVPYVAGVVRNAAGVSQSNNLSRPNPNFGAITVANSLGKSWYNAMFLQIKKRFSHDWTFSAGYTLAKAESLTGGGADGGGSGVEGAFGGGSFADQFNLDKNRGTASTDQRHRLVVNGVWEPKRASGGAAKLINGIRFSSIFSAESGRPISAILNIPSLPFLYTDGMTYNGYSGLRGQGGGSDRNQLPTIERNSIYGDANYRLDFRMARDLRIREHMVFEVIGEAFNLFNRSNFNGYFNTIYTAGATLNTTPLSTPVVLEAATNFKVANNDGSAPDGTNARRFQVSLRFRF